MPSTPPRYAWKDGKVVPWDECVLHGRTQGAFMGANVFEGLRAYWSSKDNELYIFRNAEHMERLARSMKTVRMQVPFSLEDITRGSLELLRANDFKEDVHYVPVAYFGMGFDFDVMGPAEQSGVYITAIAKPQSAAQQKGVAVCISSWRRISDDSVPPRVKAGANYQNSRIAQAEARINGYDTSIILNHRGTVAEGPGACLMMVRDGVLVTPPVTAGILESVTRATLMELAARELGLPVLEREIDRTELYAAQEAFFCGSGWEVMPITSVDRLPVGAGTVGSVTRRIQDTYFAAARGENPAYRHWLTPVYAGAREPAGARA